MEGFFVNALDTTGAGDAFTASVLSGLLDHPAALGEKQALEILLRHANACGALTTTRRGAIPALPKAQELRRFMEGYEH